MSIDFFDLQNAISLMVQDLALTADRSTERLMWIAAFHSCYLHEEVMADGAAKAADAALEQYKKRFGDGT